jgi:hypothetical protein
VLRGEESSNSTRYGLTAFSNPGILFDSLDLRIPKPGSLPALRGGVKTVQCIASVPRQPSRKAVVLTLRLTLPTLTLRCQQN